MNDPSRISSDKLLEILLLSPVATAVFTGKDSIIRFANSAMISFWHKDASVIGKPIQSALPELVGQPFFAILENVWLTGVDYEDKDAPAHFEVNGRLQTFYFDYSFKALKDSEGITYSILNTATDVTERNLNRDIVEKAVEQEQSLINEKALNENLALANQKLSETNNKLQLVQQTLYELNNQLEQRVLTRTHQLLEAQGEAERQRDRLKQFFMQSPAGICVLDGPDLVFELVNPGYQQLFPGRQLLGKPLAEAIPEITFQPIWNVLHDVYNTGKMFEGNQLNIPLARTEGGEMEDRYFNFIYQARHDGKGKIDGILVFVFEVTDVVLTSRQMRSNESRFKFLLNAIPQQVWTAKSSGELDYVNQVVCDDFGYSLPEIVGHGWQKFIHPADLENCLTVWTAALQNNTEYMVEFRLLFSDGQYKWHLARALPLIEDGKTTLWVGTNTNIHLQKSNEQRKDEFLSIASHELKTPLTSIKAFNQLMQRSGDANQMGRFVKKSAEHITRLERLIADLLDVTKINAGKMSYDMVPFNFGQMLKESVESASHISPSHQIILEEAVDVFYKGDQFRLEQVVHNFLSNAIKYSPNATKVIVRSKIEMGNIVVSVQDFGIGIEQDNLDRLFDRYYRVDNTAMRFEGLGLGLFISSEILKGHKGSFWIESQPGEGSVFYFRLPVEVSETKNTIIDTPTFYQDSSITVAYNEKAKRLDVDWVGYQNMETVQHGGYVMLRMLGNTKCNKVLNDNTNVLGTWSEASDWAGKEWFPMMANAGLRYFAWVFSSSAFSMLSAKKSVDVAVGDVVTQFFTESNLAKEWLDGTSYTYE